MIYSGSQLDELRLRAKQITLFQLESVSSLAPQSLLSFSQRDNVLPSIKNPGNV